VLHNFQSVLYQGCNKLRPPPNVPSEQCLYENQLMHFREIIVCFENNRETDTLCKQTGKRLNLKLLVHIVTLEFEGFIS